MAAFKKNENVQWKYLGRPIYGKVEEVFFESITKTIKGKKITRNGSKEKPAYLVKSEAGNIALKLETELEKVMKSSAKTPRVFAKD
ncbi:DUF2945 domain-containing protein [Bdellovibrio sp. ZAP7]|uniref:DUF2945 domain-containing protein n=1 Tax=Bdellovibrio sp. ZAP7 TaxID=2231053 RepID=UPI00115B7E57|nr:DUF2945 domain-containing protein [Bdellovibrio sp. ZAP7]QDK47058.1 DUF2945 domain-containing protein [Bdellovibrio sp. ZAP7]